MNDLNRLARVRQDLLTGTADRLAHEAGFVKRPRKVTGSNFAQALVFSFLGDSKAPASCIQCTAAAVGLPAARQSLEERSTPPCADFLKRWLAAATAPMAATPVVIALLDRFPAVEVLDSSLGTLPTELAAVDRGGVARAARLRAIKPRSSGRWAGI